MTPSHYPLCGYLVILSWKESLSSLPRHSPGLLLGSFLSFDSKEHGKEEGGTTQLSHHKRSSVPLYGIGLTIV